MTDPLHSDSEPEEVTQESSKKQIKVIVSQEEKAKQALATKLKQERRLKNERNVVQQMLKKQSKSSKLDAECSNDTFSAILNDVKNKQIDLDDKTMIHKASSKSKMKSKTVKPKVLKTPSTKFEVLDYADIDSIKNQTSFHDALQFKNSMAFNKKRNPRTQTGGVGANQGKRSFL